MAIQSAPCTLVVDLDKTLIRTDTLVESFLYVLKSHPQLAFRALVTLSTRGRLEFKKTLASEAVIDVSRLPYNEDVLRVIRQYKSQSCNVILASASDSRLVKSVADHLGIFDEWQGSDGVNLKGRKKLEWLGERINTRESTYIGDSKSDIPIWESGMKAVVVNPSRALRSSLSRRGISYETLTSAGSPLKELLRACRIHQWAKNALVLLPMIAAGQILSLVTIGQAVLAAFAFSLVASCVYMLNDLLDLEADRKHAKKCKRPFAAGTLPVETGMVAIPVLLTVAIGVSALLPIEFAGMLGIYLFSNLLYSFRLKKVIALDVVLLAMMYGMRVMAGGFATSIEVSTWLLAFCIMFFFGLAVLKRYTEVARLLANKTSGRGYRREDKGALMGLGIGGSLLSVLVFILYLNSGPVAAIYNRPEVLWFIALLLLGWVCRIWLLAARDEVDDDPVVFALKDKGSYVIAAFTLLLLLIAYK